MLSKTLTSGLAQYRIGPKIRALRQGKKLGLVQLGHHTGLSPAMLSKIERGQQFPTLPTLLRIALVFSVGLDHFFVEESDAPAMEVVRRKDRIRLPDVPGKSSPSYYFESLDFPVSGRTADAYLAEFPLHSQASASHRHAGTEFIFVVKGYLGLTVEDRDVVLEEGDSVHFDSAASHRYRRAGDVACHAVVVVTPA